MKNIRNAMKSLWKDESAQGATEYILLLVVVVSLAFIFKRQIIEAVNAKMGSISTEMGSFNVEK
jgi:Flp pilus assembly pilin Flp